ncbi:uncharacterized protein J8A68_005188 [[Candida] subhashii]|uniref:Elongin-A n=1 Tax=[Candida] subhashii TaxID=561895 RepID=A0A8J5Q747_9ASCO|nr:uncharacterized protein J8A68_005188 [[Candida] subhashii]KAG7661296.1 hypothetical protein J8A68_005188 [[Candida] subhashii]
MKEDIHLDDDILLSPKRKFPTLVYLATCAIQKHVNKVEDIGDTPYHLVQPILSQMSAKQLNQIETVSPQIVPHSDRLWLLLIEHDFPDRSRKLNPLKDGGLVKMPYKELYYKYLKDREMFRQDSTNRLRYINERLRLKKSENKVVAVNEVLKDPTIRRRSHGMGFGINRSSSSSNGSKGGSILNKVRKDMQNRSIIFSKPVMKAYDPFAAFKEQKPKQQLPIRQPVASVRRTTFFDSAHERGPNVLARKEKDPPTVRKPSSPPRISSPPPEVDIKKRKNVPSIFLQSKRPVLKQHIPRKKADNTQKNESHEDQTTTIKPTKSSIFS